MCINVYSKKAHSVRLLISAQFKFQLHVQKRRGVLNMLHFSLILTSPGNNFNDFSDSQVSQLKSKFTALNGCFYLLFSQIANKEE